MARKFDLISELYERTCFAVTDNPVNWQSFLKTAGRNFRLRFDEQLLIYAQRPDATAVLEIERWNGTFGRWVNRGAKGIAVFEDTDRSRQRLIHYFDISDTHESRHSRPVPIWEMRPEYEAEVIETLENTFGAVNDTTSIENVVKESIANAVEDNIADYISDFMSLGAGSDIEYLSADEANALYLELVRNSVSYMVMARLGLNADKVYSPDDFAGISSFNSQEVLNAVGIATSDIAEMALLPVSRTISTLSKENRIIDEQEQSEYNKDIKDERSQSDERNHIHDGGRLQSSEPETAGADGSDSRQMVADEENLSEGTSQNPVLQSSDERDSEQSLGGGSAESQRTGGNSREADGTESRADGADESGRYDEVGSPDEQHQELGTGNREESGKSIIDRCTASVYRDYQQRGYTGTVPTLQDFRAELLKQDEPEAKEIALAIELFTHGSLNTFAKPTNVDTDNRLICYDILDLGKQLMPIGMLVVLDSILNRITQNRAKGKQTFIFIDEIYLLFQHEYSANFLFTLWKRVRKYGAYATGITQNVDDLLQSHTARTMLANSEFLIMLNQASTDRIELAKLLNISDLQLSYITNVDAGHGLIKVGSSLVPFANKFPKNTKLYKLMTTKPGEGA